MQRTYIFAITAFTVASLFFAGCNVQPSANTNLEEAKRQIAASNAVYFKAFINRDSSIFINRYAKDCRIMAPNAPAFYGAGVPLKFFKLA